MPRATVLASAQSDLGDIWYYIAQDSPQNADRFIDRIYDFCVSTLAYQPMMGRSRDELALGLRSHVFQRYVIFYRPIDDGAEIVRVLHGNRDIEAQFGPDAEIAG